MSSDGDHIERALVRDWGWIIGTQGLRHIFGYATQSALRQAICRGHLPVRVFPLQGRRGVFAHAQEVAAWLTKLAPASAPDHSSQEADTKRTE